MRHISAFPQILIIAGLLFSYKCRRLSSLNKEITPFLVFALWSYALHMGSTRVTYFDDRESYKEFWIALGKGLFPISEGWQHHLFIGPGEPR